MIFTYCFYCKFKNSEDAHWNCWQEQFAESCAKETDFKLLCSSFKINSSLILVSGNILEVLGYNKSQDVPLWLQSPFWPAHNLRRKTSRGGHTDGTTSHQSRMKCLKCSFCLPHSTWLHTSWSRMRGSVHIYTCHHVGQTALASTTGGKGCYRIKDAATYGWNAAKRMIDTRFDVFLVLI